MPEAVSSYVTKRKQELAKKEDKQKKQQIKNLYKYDCTKQESNVKYSTAELNALKHNIKRFFYYHCEKQFQMTMLSKEAVNEGFKEISKEYSGEDLLKRMKEFYLDNYCIIQENFIKVEKGLLLYGPPGTGKTTLVEKLPEKVGLIHISHPISSSEVNRPHVGETERVIHFYNHIFERQCLLFLFKDVEMFYLSSSAII